MNEAGIEEFIFDQIALADFSCNIIKTQWGIVLAFENYWNINEFNLIGEIFSKFF